MVNARKQAASATVAQTGNRLRQFAGATVPAKSLRGAFASGKLPPEFSEVVSTVSGSPTDGLGFGAKSASRSILDSGRAFAADRAGWKRHCVPRMRKIPPRLDRDKANRFSGNLKGSSTTCDGAICHGERQAATLAEQFVPWERFVRRGHLAPAPSAVSAACSSIRRCAPGSGRNGRPESSAPAHGGRPSAP